MTEPVNAQVRYLNPEWKGSSEPPHIGDRDSRRANTSKHEVSIYDARGLELGLDSAGFLLTNHESAVRDFHDKEEVAATYYREVTDLIQNLTGADEVFIAEHVVRTEDTSDFNSAYARFVHCDYSTTDPQAYAQRTLELREVELDPARQWEFAWYNTWQPIEREVQQNPLAMIDVRTLAEGDVVDYYFTGYGNEILTSMPVFNPQHRFYQFSRMQTNELLVLKQLDTRPGLRFSCPHTSFDLEAPADALPRRSIEVRLMCAFGG